MSQGKNRAVIDKIEHILATTCDASLDDEYRELSFKILKEISGNKKLCQSLSRGKPESWAAGILTVLGRVNFLSDSSFEPHMTLEQLAKSCGVSCSTGAAKADLISAELNIHRGPAGTEYHVSYIRDRYENGFASPLDIIGSIRELLDELFDANQQDVSPEMHPPAIRIFSDTNDSDEPDIIFLHSETIYQIKISLKDSNPEIWRRIQVPDMPLNILSIVIEVVMGWDVGNPHHFEIDHELYGDPMMSNNIANETEMYLSDLELPDNKTRKFTYLCDFGDGWEHDIVIEKQFESMEQWLHPLCIAGENACPPENCGGISEYKKLFEAKNDPNNNEFIESANLKKFDLADVNHVLSKLRRTPDLFE